MEKDKEAEVGKQFHRLPTI